MKTDTTMTPRELVKRALVGEPIPRPAVGPLAGPTVAETFLAAIGTGRGAEQVMGLAWRDVGLLRVERRAPLATASGKILHLHAIGSTLPRPS